MENEYNSTTITNINKQSLVLKLIYMFITTYVLMVNDNITRMLIKPPIKRARIIFLSSSRIPRNSK